MYQLIKKEPELVLQGPKGLLRIYAVDQNAVRITATARDHFLDDPDTEDRTPVVLDPSPRLAYELEESQDSVTMKLKNFAVQVALETGAITYLGRDGSTLVREPAAGGRSMEEVTVYRNEFSGDGDLKETHSVDGVKVTGGEFRTVEDRKAYHAKVEFVFGDEGLYGFGSHEEGYGNLRGKSRQLYQQNMKACVPSFVSTKGYGFLFDCGSLMTFEDNAYGSYVWMDVVDQLDYYFMAGANYKAVLGAYRRLTGSAPMVPKWAFGYGQSKEFYKTSQELLSIVEEYRKRKIPLSFIVQDWQSWEWGKWGQKSFDPTRYPDPDALTRQLHEMGAALMVSIWPNMNGMGENQQEMLEKGYMLGNRSTYDAFRKGARDLYWKQAEEGYFSHGTDAWWCDCTEPFEADWHGTIKPEPSYRQNVNTDAAKKYLDEGLWQEYSLNHSRGIYEGQRASGSEKRVINLTRSSFAGQHRYATVTWSGDIGANWETLKRQIPEGLNFVASGEPYWSFDIGAFFTAPGKEWFRCGDYPQGCEDLGYRELYTRWLQLGTFMPMMRSHGTDTPREIWRFGEEGTPFYDAIAKFIRLRSALVPMIYSLAGQVTLHDGTFLTPMGLAFPEDPACLKVDHQFLFGDSLLVCPVTAPMYYEANSQELSGVDKTWEVYLPAGSCWYDFWTGKGYQGGRTVIVDAPLDRMPLFVKAGGLVPLGPEVEYPAQDPHPALTVRVYPGADGSFTLYDDEGDSYRYERGAYTETTLTWDDSARALTIGARQGSYPGMPESQTYRVVLGDEEKTVTVENGQAVTVAF